jgi:hypothetical protein
MGYQALICAATTMVKYMKPHTQLTDAFCGALLITAAIAAVGTLGTQLAQASPVTVAPMKTATASGDTQNTRSTVLITTEQTASGVVTATLDAQVLRRTPTFNRAVVVDPKWKIVTTGCRAPIVSKPTAIYPVPSPGLVVAPRASSACVSGNTVTTFTGTFSFNANREAPLVGGDRMKTLFRIDVTKDSRILSISAGAVITEYSGDFTAGSRTPWRITSSVSVSKTTPY